MPPVINAKHISVITLAKMIRDILVNDESGVIISFHRNADPEKIIDTVNTIIGGYEVNMVVRHVEMRDYLIGIVEEGAKGAAVGAPIGAATAIIAALSAGNPITFSAVLTAAGIGAAVGLLFGAGKAAATEHIYSLTVYKYKGETRLKLEQAA